MMEHIGSGNYGWRSAAPVAAHQYIVPAVLNIVTAKKGVEVLDLGCGTGIVAKELTRCGCSVVGVDAAMDAIEYARQDNSDGRFFLRSVYDSYADMSGKFDWVVSCEVIEHLYHPRRLISVAYEVLKPGGYLLITTPYHGYLKNVAISLFGLWDSHHDVSWDGGHIKFFSRATLARMVKKGRFEEMRFRYCGRVTWLWKSMICIARKPLK